MNASRIKLFVFPRMFAIPNLSPFCCKLETWLRVAKIPYVVVETGDPRTAPRRKLPYIEDEGVRIADSSLIVDHLSRKPKVLAYARRMLGGFFPELEASSSSERPLAAPVSA